MSGAPTEQDGRMALRDHLLEKARMARARHVDLGERGGVLALLNDPEVVRYPTGLRFDAEPLREGEFAWAMPLGDHPSKGFCLVVHPAFEEREQYWGAIVAYHIPPINYGEIVTPEDCEAFGAALLSTDTETYYHILCGLADSLSPAGAVGSST